MFVEEMSVDEVGRQRMTATVAMRVGEMLVFSIQNLQCMSQTLAEIVCPSEPIVD